MGCQAIIHGRITVRDHAKARSVIQSFSNDTNYPWFRLKNFSEGETVSPFYYDEPVIGFAATYKYSDWQDYVIKIECLLAHIDFISAKMELETEYEGNFNFTWLSRETSYIPGKDDDLVTTEKWRFGFGRRDMWGHRLTQKENYESLPEFAYPLQIKMDTVNILNNLIERIHPIEQGKRFLLNDHVESQFSLSEDVYRVLLIWKGCQLIHYGYDSVNRGIWIEKLGLLPPLRSTVQEYLFDCSSHLT